MTRLLRPTRSFRPLRQLCPFLIMLTGWSKLAAAQALPADTGPAPPGVGFSLPRLGGSLSYGLSLSELVSTGFYSDGTGYSTNIGGDLAYVSKSQFHPFSAVYDGGVLVANSNQPTTFYQSLSFSQVLNTKNWNITLSDSVSYLPETPIEGLSGVPGVGDLGVDPVSVGPASGLGILTTYGPRVSNSTSGTVGRRLSGRLTAQVNGIFAIQRFISDNSQFGLNSTTEGGSGGLSDRLSARDTLSGNYSYTHFSFPGTTDYFNTQGITVQYSRQWSRRLVTDVYAGPQIVGGSAPLTNGTAVTVAAGASASYLSRLTTYSLAYARGVNNGSGVIPGAVSDTVTATAHRQFGRNWSVSGDVGFSRDVSLPNFTLYQFNGKGVFAGAQGSRRLWRDFSCYLSYTVEDQTLGGSSASVTDNAFSGVYQVFSVGISYAPRSIFLGR